MTQESCKLGDKCCNGESQPFWIEDPSKLFCNLSPIPKGNYSSGQRLNSITRFILYSSSVMYITGYKYTFPFLILGMIFVLLIYVNSKKTIENENFAFLSDDMLNMNSLLYFAKQQPSNPELNSYIQASDSIVNNTQKMSQQNSYKGSVETRLKGNRMDVLPGKRDESSGITYYTVNSGVNRKTMIPPVLQPRLTDTEVWGDFNAVPNGINERHMTDVTQSDIDYVNTSLSRNDDPYSLAKPVRYEPRVKGSPVPQNRLGENPDIGHYSAEEFYYGNGNRNDFKDNEMRVYQNFYNSKNNIDKNIKNEEEMKKAPTKEKFSFVNLNDDNILQQQYGKMAAPLVPDRKNYNKMNRAPPGEIPPQTTPITEQLLSESPTYVYNDDYFNQPATRTYLREIQPKLYSWSPDQTPINANIGISYTPQTPPRFMDQVANAEGNNYPLMTRIDPQLIRDDGTPGQININPVRTEWSAKYSDFEAPAGSINFEDIYDPRFNSYGDPYRSYSDVNLGQVRYYYSDVDAYRQPNFISRSNVDFVDFRNPNGQIWPYYERSSSLQDVKAQSESQTTADELYHREDMMSQLMRKSDRSSWQLKFAPFRKSSNGNSTYGPS